MVRTPQNDSQLKYARLFKLVFPPVVFLVQMCHINTAALCVSAVRQTACSHQSFGLTDKTQSPDWDFAIVFSNKAYGLTVNTKGLSDNFHLDQV